MIKTQLHLYTTQRYAPGWRHLDSSRSVGEVALTPRKTVHAGNGYDEGPTYIQHARLPRGMNRVTAARGLVDTISGSGCRHEHDCCGCASTSVSVRPLSKRDLLVRSRVSYNY